MLKKHSILIGIFISVALFLTSAAFYSGGSQKDKHSIGYDWENNYLCNLFSENAVNGAPNPSRIWAIIGLFFVCVSFALFFYNFSTKISDKISANIIKYGGIGAMFCSFWIFTPYHDLMTTLSSILALFAIFYVTVAIFKSKRHVLKLLCGACLAILYLNNYIYYTHHGLEYLPILQKISFLIGVAMILGIDYFTTEEDFKIIPKPDIENPTSKTPSV
jgi:hypothetical protein